MVMMVIWRVIGFAGLTTSARTRELRAHTQYGYRFQKLRHQSYRGDSGLYRPRADGGEPKVEYWDTVQHLIRKKVKESDGSALAAQADKQEPLAGLLCMPDPKVSSRTLAAQYYRELRGCGRMDDYLPNTVFNMTGSAFNVPLMPFGPYVIAGFYYSVKYLNLKDQMVMGYDQVQTNRIVQKIYNDPIMNLITKKFEV